MPPLKVTPLAFESLGVRSSALSIESDDLKIVIDPAVALAPARFGLPPHPVEEQAKTRLWEKVRENALAADILVVTHYHLYYDSRYITSISSARKQLVREQEIYR